jgi:hypothetical protein
MTAIANMKRELALLEAALGLEGTKPAKATKTKKEKDPDAPKKEANPWIKFSNRVGDVLKAADIKAGAATVPKQFASALKEQNGDYDSWTEETILAAWKTWTKPEQSKQAIAKAASGDEASVSSEKKARKPLSEEAKKAAAEKRAATLAAKKAAAQPAEPKPVEAEPVKAEAVEAEAPKPVEAPKKQGKQVAKKATPAYTLEQLQDFAEFEHDGEEYGKNERGDLVDGDGNYCGHWDGKKITNGPKPADWAQVQPGSE